MFKSGRFVQWAMVCWALAGCAHTATTGSAQLRSAAESSTVPTPTRIGPTSPGGSIAGPPFAAQALRPEVLAFAQELAHERDLPLEPIVQALSTAQYNPTVARLIAPAPPGKKIWRSWNTYRSRFVEPKRIQWGLEFWRENQLVLNQAAQRYGVPASIIVSIIGVETLYGRNMGSFRVLDALTTLAFDYPDPNRPERARMFRGQLADFITLSMQNKLSWDATGSFAGAIGMPQFMPGSIKQYAIDGDGDGHIALSRSVDDAIMSVGNFLVEHGWLRGLPVFAPVQLPADPSALATGGLTPTQSWQSLQAAGARLQPGASLAGWQDRPLGVVDLVEEARGTVQYRTATPNFFALTQYNRSYFYATAVNDLASALEAKMPR